MKYGLLFSLCGILFGYYAVRCQGPAWMLLWVGVSFLLDAFTAKLGGNRCKV